MYDERHVISRLLAKGYLKSSENQALFDVAADNLKGVIKALEGHGMKIRSAIEEGFIVSLNMTPDEIHRKATAENKEPIQPIYPSCVMNYADSVIIVLLRTKFDEGQRGGEGREAGWVFEEDLNDEFGHFQASRTQTDEIGTESRIQTILSRLTKQGFIERRSMKDAAQYRITTVGLLTFGKEECAEFMSACQALLDQNQENE